MNMEKYKLFPLSFGNSSLFPNWKPLDKTLWGSNRKLVVLFKIILVKIHEDELKCNLC